MVIQPQAVIFDYGNVLCAPQELADLQSMAEIFALPEAVFYPLYWRYRLPYDEAALDANSYWNTVASDAGRSLSDAQIQQLRRLDVESWARPSPVMVEWARLLREGGVKTAVLSNMPMDLRVYVTGEAGWMPEFDHMTFSCDVRMVKPKPGIYQHCLDGLKIAPSEALFFDDRVENIEAAERLGIHCVLFTTPAEAIEALDGKFSLPVALRS